MSTKRLTSLLKVTNAIVCIDAMVHNGIAFEKDDWLLLLLDASNIQLTAVTSGLLFRNTVKTDWKRLITSRQEVRLHLMLLIVAVIVICRLSLPNLLLVNIIVIWWIMLDFSAISVCFGNVAVIIGNVG